MTTASSGVAPAALVPSTRPAAPGPFSFLIVLAEAFVEAKAAARAAARRYPFVD